MPVSEGGTKMTRARSVGAALGRRVASGLAVALFGTLLMTATPAPGATPPAPVSVSDLVEQRLHRSLSILEHGSDRRAELGHTSPDVYTYYRPVEDMTGDGLDDIVQVTREHVYLEEGNAEEEAEVTLTLLRGHDGKWMWSRRRSAVDGSIYVIRADLGRRGRAGFYIVRTYEPWVDVQMRIEAITGRGEVLWTRTIAPKASRENLSYSALFNGLRGKADDLLFGKVTTIKGAEGLGPLPDEPDQMTSSSFVVDGRTGKIREHPAEPTRSGVYAIPDPAGDLTGDRLDDYVMLNGPVYSAGYEPDRLRARRGTNGEQLWTSEEVATTYGSVVSSIDLDGTRLVDLVVHTWPWAETRRDRRYNEPIFALDGSDGRVLWRDQAMYFGPTQDVDDDGAAEALLVKPSNMMSRRGAAVVARSGDGRVRYRRFHRVQSEEPGRLYTDLSQVGDAGVDGHPDLLLSQSVGRRTTKTLVSGRTGRGRPLPMGGAPVYGSVDNRGHDLFTGVDEQRFRVYDGVSLRPYWKGRLRLRDMETYWYPEAFAARVRHSRCADIFVFVEQIAEYGSGSALLLSVDGRSGQVRWSRAHAMDEPARFKRVQLQRVRCRP